MRWALTSSLTEATAIRDQDDAVHGMPLPGYWPDGSQCPAGVGVTTHYSDISKRPGQSQWAVAVTASTPTEATVSWSVMMAFVRRVRDALHAQDMSLMINTTASPWFMTDADSTLMLAACDGVALELAFSDTCIQLGSRVDAEVARYRQWLAAGKLVLLIPRGDIGSGEYATIARWIAALACIIREPGDSLFVTSPSYLAKPEWCDWTADLGAPTASYTVTHDGPTHSRYSRTFSGGTVTVEHTAAVVTAEVTWL